MALLVNKVLGELTEAQKQKVVAGDASPLEPLMEQYLDLENGNRFLFILILLLQILMVKRVVSIPIDARWPDAAYTLTAHYGYF